MGVGRQGDPSYSAGLLQAFVRVLREHPNLPPDWAPALQSMRHDVRVPIERGHELLELAIQATGDPALPVKAGRAVLPGDAGAFDYVMMSSPTVAEALNAAGRFIRVVNDAMHTALDVDGEWASLKLMHDTPVPTSAEDFGLASFFTNCLCRVLGGSADVEVWFRHGAPPDITEHTRTFGKAHLRFDSPWAGYRFAAARMQQPVPTADPNLNEVLLAYLERTLHELPRAQTLVDRARQVIRRELPRGHATAPRVARELGMSRRTLCRRLEEDHTSFSELLDDVRRRQGLELVAQGQLALSEIAFLLGFAQTAGFHRAFKRWTGQTPLEYRAKHG